MKRRISKPLAVLFVFGFVTLPALARAQQGHLGVICFSDADCAPGLVCSGLPGPAVCIQASQAGLPGSTPEKPSAQAPPGVFGGPFPADPNYAAEHPSPPPAGGPPKYVTVPEPIVHQPPLY
jgi:hypothetical protein